MKKLGIIGGLGPESTVEYYKEVIRAYRERVTDGSQPEFIVNSVNMKRVFELVGTNDLDGLADYLLSHINSLAKAGVDFAIISANMPHLAFDKVRPRSPVPMISIVETASEAAKARRLKRVGIFGTRFVMEGRLYPDVFARQSIEVCAPNDDDRTFVHDIYVNQLLKGIVLSETREQLLLIVHRMKRDEGIDGLLLGGTELSLILKSLDGTGLELMDTMKIQVQAAVTEMLS